MRRSTASCSATCAPLGVGGLAAKLDVQTPLLVGTVRGDRRRSASHAVSVGLADPRVRFMVNFIGAPALAGPDFATYRQGTVVGAGIQMVLPLGQYDPARLVNLGSNRWSFRPELGVSRRQGRFFLELAGGAWLFTRNGDYYGATTLDQEPLYFAKANVIYNFKRRGLWLSAQLWPGARAARRPWVGVAKQDIQTNDRAGVHARRCRSVGRDRSSSSTRTA